MTNANIVTVEGHPHDIRCPQSGRTDVDYCCKPMVAFTATMEERERCAKVAESEPELEGPMPPENVEAAKLVSLEDHLRITVRLTKTNIARRIRET